MHRKMDLIVLLDASGSLTEVGFAILCTFTATLTSWFHEAALLFLAMGVWTLRQMARSQLREPWCPRSDFWHRLCHNDDFECEVAAWLYEHGTGVHNGWQGALAGWPGRRPGRVLVLSGGRYSFKYQTAVKACEIYDHCAEL